MAFDAPHPEPRHALVTGGAGGIGQAICRRLAAAGYRIALADLDPEAAAEHATACGEGHVALAADLTDPDAAATLPARAAQALGGLHLVVNNAGMTDGSGRSLIDLPYADFDRLVALNLTAVERISAAAAGLLPKGGRIVNVASGAAFRPLALRGPYSATKAGVVALTEALAEQLAPNGIAVSAVAPGYTRTPLVEALAREGRIDLDAVARGIPLGRIATPEDIAGAVAFCAGRDGGALGGRTLLVDGGSSAGAAPQGAAPAQGKAARGCVAMLGALDIVGMPVEASRADRLPEIDRLAAVIDSTALDCSAEAAEVLSRARDTARRCAAHRGRTRDFALLFVAGRGDDAAARAAAAAQGMFARTLALEWAQAGIRVNAVLWCGRSRAGLGALCAFLTGPEAGFITGQTIVAGGRA